MIRLGIVGSDSSHALAFAQILNTNPNPVPGWGLETARVTHLFGLDPGRTREVAEKGQIETIVEDPLDMVDQVDGVMIVFRHGDLHAPYALPFLDRRIPTWVDKPFVLRPEDGLRMIQTAKKRATLLTGGSTNRLNPDVLMLQQAVAGRADIGPKIGKILGGCLNYPIMLENAYGGFPFYASHLAEMAFTIFGPDLRSVRASQHQGSVVVIAKYDDFQIVLQYVDSWGTYYGSVFGETGCVSRVLNDSLMYSLGLAEFLTMIRTQSLPFPLERLLLPVAFHQAVLQSLASGAEVALPIIPGSATGGSS